MAFGFLIKIYAYLRERGEPFSIPKQGRLQVAERSEFYSLIKTRIMAH